MSNFYSNLAKDALDDSDDYDASDSIHKIVANVDELDAALFGTSLKEQKSTAPIAVPTSDTMSHLPLQLVSSVSRKSGLNKSQLMAELFGEVNVSQTKNPKSIPLIQQEKSLDSHFELPLRLKTSPVTETSASKDSNYYIVAHHEDRRRRARPLDKNISVTDDLWSKFLQADKSDVGQEETDTTSHLAKKSDGSVAMQTAEIFTSQPQVAGLKSLSPVSSPCRSQNDFEQYRASTNTNIEDQNFISSANSRQKVEVPQKYTISEQFEMMRPYIDTLIAEKWDSSVVANNQNSSRIDELKLKLDDYNSNSFSTVKKIVEDELMKHYKTLQDTEEKLTEEILQLETSIKQYETELQKKFVFLENSTSQRTLEMETKLTTLEQLFFQHQEQKASSDASILSTLQDMSLKLHSQLASKLEEVRNTFTQNLQHATSKIQILEDLCSVLNVKIDEQANKWGEGQLMRIASLESKYRQLQLNQRSTCWEEDIEFRLEKNENNFESRISVSNKQQARLGAWLEKEIANLSEYFDQRLWSLHNQITMQQKEIISLVHRLNSQESSMLEPCSEAQVLKSEMRKLSSFHNEREDEQSSKIKSLETRLSNVEHENFRLSRLADRLCNLLQMWEQRHKSASRAEADTLQSLQERYNMAVIEMRLDNK